MDSAVSHASDLVAEARAGTARRPVVRTFFNEPTFTASHVVFDSVTLKASIIDSVLDFDPVAGRTSRASADAVVAFVRALNL